MDERRIHERRQLRATATLLLPGGHRFDVRVSDISAGGCSIMAPVNPQPGTAFRIALALPVPGRPQQVVETAVQVSHSILAAGDGGFKVGLRYTALDAAAASAIIAFLRPPEATS